MSAVPSEIFHEVTSDGRERHYWQWDGEKYVCECGAERDRFGRDVLG